MKKAILFIVSMILMQFGIYAQDYTQQMEAAVSKLDKATTVNNYQMLASDFIRIANGHQTHWLPYYYAAYCNAKTGWLNQQNPEKIEPFANLADEQIKKALSLVDSTTHKEAVAEIYCVISMVNRAKVFINPMTQGSKYGPAASQCIKMTQALDSENPRAMNLEAWEKYYTPKTWGGDKNKARELLEQALVQLENESSSGIQPHWGKADCEALLKEYQ